MKSRYLKYRVEFVIELAEEQTTTPSNPHVDTPGLLVQAAAEAAYECLPEEVKLSGRPALLPGGHVRISLYPKRLVTSL